MVTFYVYILYMEKVCSEISRPIWDVLRSDIIWLGVLKPCTNHPELNIFWMYKSFSPFSSSDCNIYLYHWQVYLFSIKRACKSCLFFKYLKLWRKINKLIMWFSTTQQQDTLVAHPDLNPIDYWCPHSWTIVAVLHADLVIQTPLLYCRYQQLGL